MIRSGCIKETQDSTCHRSTVINFALAGEMLSLHNPDDQVSSTTSVAVEASFICAVHWGSFNELCAASPGIAAEFIRLVVKAGAQARELLTLIRDKEALERIAGFLLNLSDRLQLRGVQGREFRLGMNPVSYTHLARSSPSTGPVRAPCCCAGRSVPPGGRR